MESVPRSFDNAEQATLSFEVTESHRGTEEKPILFCEKNGFQFEIRLDLFAEPEHSIEINTITRREDSRESDDSFYAAEIKKWAKAELSKRITKYGEHFA